MARKPDEDPDLTLVDELIFAPTGLKLERFSRAETLTGKTPDFKVFQAGQLVAYCEAKSPRDDWLDDQLEEARPLEVVGGLRHDPTFNRIARHVEKAANQFDAVNPARTLPNILVFVNHDKASSYNDLREVLTGMFHAEGGERFETMTTAIGVRWLIWMIESGTIPAFAQNHHIHSEHVVQAIKTPDILCDSRDLPPTVDKRSFIVMHVILTSKGLAGSFRPYYGSFRAHNAAMMAIQPAWMGPLVQSDPRLGQAIRFSVSDAAFPGEQTLNYGNNHGISMIADRRFELDLDPPSFFRNHSSAHKDGFGNAATELKWRIASGNAEHGNYAVSAIIYYAFAPRIYQNQMLTSFYAPALAAGHGFGRFAVMSKLGGILPTSRIAQQGRGIEWDVTTQVHLTAYTWFDVEDNALFNYAGPFDGKTQNFLTPAAFYMIPRRREWGPEHATVVIDGGMQIATSSLHFYNHNLISELRFVF